MLLSLLSMAAFTLPASETGNSKDSYEYNIMFLDCGRKYFSVDSIEQIIDNASAAGFNYIQLAVGNDGLRFLLDDMSLRVNGTTYSTERVADAIKAGNKAYNDTFNNKIAEDGKKADYSPTTNELTQSDMDTIIAYAKAKGMGVIPCVNTPGHMDAILSAANSLTGTNCSYSGSVRTIDVTNTTAVAFTKALLQKYINYFAGKSCQLFNMGADEYANDKFTGGAMGFGNLQSTGKYSSYVTYVNDVAAMIKDAGMKPMAFNDGIYFKNNTSSGTFDTDILICYWSSGWGSDYNPMSAANLADKGFKLINTHGDYYWVLGKNAKCSAETASNFNTTAFYGSTVNNPVGSMFCIWADYPGAETEESVISKTAATIAAFGKALPTVKKVEAVESKTVAKGDVAVTAPGLTDLTVTATTAPTIDTAAEGKVSAYDVTPATEKGSYAGSGSVSLPIPEGWDASRVRGYVVNEDGSVTTGLTGTTADGKFTFTVPHFSRMGIYELAANAATKTKEITLTVGGTKTETLAGDYSGTLLDDDFATVTGTVAEIPGKTTYKPAALGAGTFYVSTKSGDTAPTVQLTFEDAGNGQYYIKNSDGAYLYPTAGYSWLWGWEYSVTTTTKNEDAAVKVVTNNDGSIVISKTATSGRRSTTAYLTLNGTSLDASENSTSLYLYDQQTTHGGKETTLTFTGKSVGTTKVTIGDTQYIIKVTAEDLSKVTPLTIEYWITNGPVLKDKNSSTTAVSVSATKEIATETGVSVAALVPGSGIKESEKNEANAHTLEYWQAKLLNKSKPNNSSNGTEEQTTKDGDDETLSGSAFTKVRYWGGTWQVYTTEWVTVKSTDQLVAYYMEVINITNKNNVENLHVNAADWGLKGDGSTALGYNPGATCSVSVQLVYEDGSTSPSATTAAELKSKTIVYSYWNGGRGLGTMVFNGKDNYQIFKVTAETGDMSSTTSSRNTVTVDSFTWDNNEETVWEGAATDSVSIGNPVKNPSYDAPYDNLAWNTSEHNNNNAILIRVYVKSIPKAGALTVNYFVQGNADPFYHYGINVVKDTTTFDPGFARVPDEAAPGKAKLVHNTVTNYDGEQQTVQSDLSKMTEIGAQYRYSDYEFVDANRSADGKTVNLYYTFKAEKTFVIDFGLPLEIRPTDVQSGLSDVTITQVDIANQSTYANINVDDHGVITYTLNQRINGADTFSVNYHGYRGSGKGGEVQYTITVIPATSVYYEDNFATFTNANGTKNVAQVDNVDKGIWTKVTDGTTQTNVNQALEALGGTTNTKNVYGYDPAYADSSKFSMGSATKVTVDANTADNGQWPTATFTFKGTGFDVISLTNSDAGAVVYTVTNKTTGESESHFINNYYGYAYKDGQWVVTNNDETAPYQVPVIKVSGLTYDTYEVKISVVYGAAFDENKDNQYSFWLDAIRVYDPAGNTLNDEYARDGENAPNYVEVKKVILDTGALENAGAVGAVFIDGKGADGVTVADYKNQGPNHEAYLAQNQAIAFQLIANGKPSSVQIGAKLANGTSAKLSITGANCDKAINGSLTLNTATDMYYELTDLNWTQAADGTYKSNVITLANTSKGDDIVSLTNVKFIGATYSSALPSAKATEDEATVVTFAASAAMVDEAVSAVDGVLNPAPQVFAPSRFEASWGHAVRKGDTATLTVKTSEDVDSITVDGQTITTYDTKTERTGWGWWAKTVTYREFTYQVAAEETTDYTICAVNSAGVSSDPITATLTVRPSVRDWWHGIFDKWF